MSDKGVSVGRRGGRGGWKGLDGGGGQLWSLGRGLSAAAPAVTWFPVTASCPLLCSVCGATTVTAPLPLLLCPALYLRPANVQLSS